MTAAEVSAGAQGNDVCRAAYHTSSGWGLGFRGLGFRGLGA